MNYECLIDDDGREVWVSCVMIDSFSDLERQRVKYRIGQEVLEAEMPISHIRRVNLGYEPSY